MVRIELEVKVEIESSRMGNTKGRKSRYCSLDFFNNKDKHFLINTLTLIILERGG